jgi:flagellar motor protein MotB
MPSHAPGREGVTSSLSATTGEVVQEGKTPPAATAKSGTEIANEVADEASTSEAKQEENKRATPLKNRKTQVQAAQKSQNTKQKKRKRAEEKFAEAAGALVRKLDGTTSKDELLRQRDKLRELAKGLGKPPEDPQSPDYETYVQGLANLITDYFERTEVNLSNRGAVLEFFTKNLFPEAEPEESQAYEQALKTAMKRCTREFHSVYGKQGQREGKAQLAQAKKVRRTVVAEMAAHYAVFKDPVQARKFLTVVSLETNSADDIESCLKEAGIIPKGSSQKDLEGRRSALENMQTVFSSHTGAVAKANKLDWDDPTLTLTLRFFKNFNSMMTPYNFLEGRTGVMKQVEKALSQADQHLYREFRQASPAA